MITGILLFDVYLIGFVLLLALGVAVEKQTNMMGPKDRIGWMIVVIFWPILIPLSMFVKLKRTERLK